MGVRDQIHSTPEYQATVAESTANTESSNPVGPLIQLEKGDVEFWLEVAQVVLLVLILLELRRGGR